MRHVNRSIGVLAGLAMALLAFSPARAEIHDNAGILSAQGKSDVASRIDRIRQHTGKSVVLAGLVIVFAIVRGIGARRGMPPSGSYGQPGYGQPGYGAPGYPPQQGGGFGRGLMGGLLGGVLGGAAYDHFRGGSNAGATP